LYLFPVFLSHLQQIDNAGVTGDQKISEVTWNCLASLSLQLSRHYGVTRLSNDLLTRVTADKVTLEEVAKKIPSSFKTGDWIAAVFTATDGNVYWYVGRITACFKINQGNKSLQKVRNLDWKKFFYLLSDLEVSCRLGKPIMKTVRKTLTIPLLQLI
jgi:hypothetical protein